MEHDGKPPLIAKLQDTFAHMRLSLRDVQRCNSFFFCMTLCMWPERISPAGEFQGTERAVEVATTT